MESIHLARFKALFEKERLTLTCSFGDASEAFRLGGDGMADETDVTATEMNASMRMRLRQREAFYLRKIDEALLRIKDGTFGSCHGCGEEIEMKRLDARPTATHCLGCKEEAERRERIHSDGKPARGEPRRLKLA